MAITYRPCTAEDITKVLELWKTSAPGDPNNTATTIQTRLQRDPELFQLAWDGDQLVGSLIGAWDGWRANMYRLAVRADYRRRGIGATLVRRVERLFGDLGAERVVALAIHANPGAVPFWNELGYRTDTTLEPMVKFLNAAS